MRDSAEIWRLRRFALTTALLLFAWSAAGVTVGAEPRFSPLGLPLQISRPDLLPIAIALATLYGTIRYFYYAFSHGPSPFRVRRDLLDRLLPEGSGRRPRVPMYTGPEGFSGPVWYSDRKVQEELSRAIQDAFPKFARHRVTTKIPYSPSADEDGEVRPSFGLEVHIPVRCRRAALFEDLDYASPVWFPLLSVAIWLGRVL